jgi:hypothetical protein
MIMRPGSALKTLVSQDKTLRNLTRRCYKSIPLAAVKTKHQSREVKVSRYCSSVPRIRKRCCLQAYGAQQYEQMTIIFQVCPPDTPTTLCDVTNLVCEHGKLRLCVNAKTRVQRTVLFLAAHMLPVTGIVLSIPAMCRWMGQPLDVCKLMMPCAPFPHVCAFVGHKICRCVSVLPLILPVE